MARRVVVGGLRATVVGESGIGNRFLLLLLFLLLLGFRGREAGEDGAVVFHDVLCEIVVGRTVEKHGMGRNELEMRRRRKLVMNDKGLVRLGVVGIE